MQKPAVSFMVLAAAAALTGASGLEASEDYALRFDGVNDYVQVPYTAGAFPSAVVTLTAWIRIPASTGRRMCIFNRGEDSSSDLGSWRLDVFPTGSLQVAIEDCSDGDGFYNVAADLDDGQWHHVAATRERNGILKVYVEGRLMASFTGTRSPCDQSRQKLTIGAEWAREGGLRTFFQGEIDNVSMWGVALTDADIQEIFDNGISDTASPDLFGYWKFDEGDGQTAFDASTSQLHGTLGASGSEDVNDPTWIPPDGGSPQLTQDPLVSGQLAHLFVTGAHPNDFVAFFVSFTGQAHNGGPCFPQVDSLCLDILAPVSYLGTRRASSGGVAVFSASIPANAPQIQVYTQAFVIPPPDAVCSRKTNWVESTIE